MHYVTDIYDFFENNWRLWKRNILWSKEKENECQISFVVGWNLVYFFNSKQIKEPTKEIEPDGLLFIMQQLRGSFELNIWIKLAWTLMNMLSNLILCTIASAAIFKYGFLEICEEKNCRRMIHGPQIHFLSVFLFQFKADTLIIIHENIQWESNVSNFYLKPIFLELQRFCE